MKKLAIVIYLIFMLTLTACVSGERMDIVLLCEGYNKLDCGYSVDISGLTAYDTGRYSVPLIYEEAECGILTAYSTDDGHIKKAGITAAGASLPSSAAVALVETFTLCDNESALLTVNDLLSNPPNAGSRYTETDTYRFSYTVNELGCYLSIESKKLIPADSDALTLRPTTSQKSA